MARRSRAALGRPTPVTSTYTTPLSSAYPSACPSACPSTYPSEDESEYGTALKLRHGGDPATLDPGDQGRAREQKAFRFLDLPTELRLRVYAFHFDTVDRVVDLDPDNPRRLHRKLTLLRTCRQIYNEAGPHFYSSFTFRVFPTASSRFSRIKKPLLARLNPAQRASITSLELRVGPGWNKPPRGWVVNHALGLRHCVRVRTVRVFVEFDPSDNFFKGFRKADGFYEEFCRGLLKGVLEGLPSVETVEFDAWKSVKMGGAMMRNLLEVVPEGCRLCWGPERGWRDGVEDEPVPEPRVTSGEMMAAIMGFEHLNIVSPPIAV